MTRRYTRPPAQRELRLPWVCWRALDRSAVLKVVEESVPYGYVLLWRNPKHDEEANEAVWFAMEVR